MQDILLDSNYDLLFSGGDLTTGESTEQHQACLLRTVRGQLFFSPETGVGIERYLKDDFNGELPEDCLGEIKEQYQKDGMENVKMVISGTQLTINGNYKETANTN